jgi:hypothetical protein
MDTKRSNAGTLVGGAILITFGLLSLVSQFIGGRVWEWLWPFIVIGVGAMFFVAMFAAGKGGAGFAIPGSIVGGIGLLLLFQNITRHWETMSYFWTFIVIFVGVGIYIMGWYGDNAGQKKSGTGVMKVGVILFISFGAFFESLFSGFDNLIFPILLILLGGYLVLSRSGLFNRKQESDAEAIPPSNNI